MWVLQLLCLPIIYFLNHCKYIQKKSFVIKLVQGKKYNFSSRAVAVWQALGHYPVSWSNWNSGLKLLNGDVLVRTKICCSDFRRWRWHLCVQNMCIPKHARSWGLSTMPLSTPVGQGSTQYFSFLGANFWANAQAVKAGCRSRDELNFLCLVVKLRSPLYR